jgi:hypothetical protein
MESKQQPQLNEREKLQKDFMDALEEKDPLKLIRTKKKIDVIDQKIRVQDKVLDAKNRNELSLDSLSTFINWHH